MPPSAPHADINNLGEPPLRRNNVVADREVEAVPMGLPMTLGAAEARHEAMR
jgi:hypothetical protein